MPKVYENGYALIVGVGGDLPCTIDDSEGLANILKDKGRCAFPQQQITLLTGKNANRDSIITAFGQMAKTVDAKSTFVIYFSSHGYRITSTTGASYYLMAHGYDLKRLYKTAIIGVEFADKLRTLPAQKILVLLDCCHAGGVGDAKGIETKKSPILPETLGLFNEGRGYNQMLGMAIFSNICFNDLDFSESDNIEIS